MKKYLIAAAIIGLASQANAQAMLGNPLNEYERGWDQGYTAINPGRHGPTFYSPPIVRSPLDGRSDFQRGIADGVDRAQEDDE